MGSKYVWLVCLSITFYVLYSYDYQRTLWMRLHFLHDSILSTVFAITQTFKESLPETSPDSTLFTKSQLAKYSNSERGLYLAILGKVYDVTKGEKHYGPGGTYHSFVGRDASLAFITGEFDEAGLTDDVSSLTPRQIKSLNDWTNFYGKDYVYKGKLIGRYYDANGNPTDESYKVKVKLALAEEEQTSEEQRKRLFPPCNIEWAPDIGTRVWCTKRSGGIERDWVGVPRMLYEPGSDQHRCTCVNVKSKEYETYKGSLRQYEDCPESSTNCVIRNTSTRN